MGMTEQQAIEVLEKHFPAVPNADVRYAAAMGVQALKKQIPIKALNIRKYPNHSIIGECSICKRKVIKCNYCPNCGQKFDFRGE